MSIYDVFNNNKKKPFDKEQYAQQKKAERDAAYELVYDTCKKIQTDGQAFQNYLKTQGQFDRYTVTNAILVSAQMPSATQLKDKEAWKKSRVYVNQDAKGITILEPGKEYKRDDGGIGTSINTKKLFDISHTSARVKVEGMEQRPMRELLSGLVAASPVPIQPVPDLELPAFYDQSQQLIFVKTRLPENQLFMSVGKEVAAAIFDIKHREDREDSEFKSFCVAYMVSSKYGVDTSEISFDQLPEGLSELDSKELRDELLDPMRDVLGEIHNDMFKKLEQVRGAKSREQEQQER